MGEEGILKALLICNFLLLFSLMIAFLSFRGGRRGWRVYLISSAYWQFLVIMIPIDDFLSFSIKNYKMRTSAFAIW